MDWLSGIGMGLSFVDGLIYSEQEKQGHLVERERIGADREHSRALNTGALAGLQAAETQAATMKMVAVLGAGVLGLGIVVYAMKA